MLRAAGFETASANQLTNNLRTWPQRFSQTRGRNSQMGPASATFGRITAANQAGYPRRETGLAWPPWAAPTRYNRNSMASQTIPYITPEEYLKAERKAEFKSEYYDGQVFAMAGGRPRHSGIATNIVVSLGAALRGKPCRTFNSDMRVHIPATGLYTYPDVSAVCGVPEFYQTDNLVNPTVVVEVLSKSTERDDRTTKFLDYRSIPSLREYVMVSQEPRSITHCTRISEAEWRIETVGEEQGVIHFTSLGVDIPFDEVYANLDSLPK